MRRRRRREYMRRVPYKKIKRSRRMTRGYDRYRKARMLRVGIPVALLAVLLIVLAVIVFTQMGGQDTPQPGNHGNMVSENSAGVKGNDNGSGQANLAGTENTPAPASSPSPIHLPSASPSPSPSPTPEPTSNGHELDDVMVIAIDAGHGGYDGGSVVGDVVEKDVNLAVAREIARILEEHGGITVVQTRLADEHVDLQKRCDIANEAKCDYLVSVHCNIYEDDSSVRGFECHYNKNSAEGEKFAQSVSDAMKQYEDMKIRAIKANDLAVTVHTYAPAILIEMGFLTNAAERRNLSDPDYQKMLAERIADAVLEAAGL